MPVSQSKFNIYINRIGRNKRELKVYLDLGELSHAKDIELRIHRDFLDVIMMEPHLSRRQIGVLAKEIQAIADIECE